MSMLTTFFAKIKAIFVKDEVYVRAKYKAGLAAVIAEYEEDVAKLQADIVRLKAKLAAIL